MATIVSAGLLLAHLFVAADATPRATPANIDLVEWFGMNPAQFGCLLEKKFASKQKKWNCKLKKYKAAGDPCKNTKAYYAGPSFPEKVAKTLRQNLENIDMKWEHGALQSVALKFDGPITNEEARSFVGFPIEGQPVDFVSVEFQECGAGKSCLVVQKFEHMGSGDVDCSGH